MTQPGRTVLFAGGGTGGHIYPNLAVLERVRERWPHVQPHFVVSQRAVDAQVMARAGLPFTAVPAIGLATSRPWTWPRFWRRYRQSVQQVRQRMAETRAAALVATGGFVSAPAIEAARQAGVPAAVVNLDAVPGKANRLMAGKAAAVFTCYEQTALPRATMIGLPISRGKVAPADVSPAAARSQLQLDPERPTLLVTAGSQGGQTVNCAMAELVRRPAVQAALADWQVLHLSGDADRDATQQAYDAANVRGRVLAFCGEMGLAWRAATAAVSRAGASSCFEIWANAVPAIFLPYPYHKDEHQRLNARPLVDRGGAWLFTDLKDAAANADALTQPLLTLLTDEPARQRMKRQLTMQQPEDGAQVVAAWVIQAVGGGSPATASPRDDTP